MPEGRTEMRIGIGTTLSVPFDQAVARTEKALAGEGFGVLTRIDVQATLKQKLGEDMPPYLILGACNPPLAHRALTAEPRIGLLLPCNVVVREVEGGTRVEAVDAGSMATLFPEADLGEVAAEVNRKLERVISSL